jgi:hypothetical protein
LPPDEITTTQSIGCTIVIFFIDNQDQTSKSKGFTSSWAPNLGKSHLLLVWYPIARVNMQDFINPEPLMVGIAEEPPRQRSRAGLDHPC